jgi:5-formyltetrahydrofolate cyclo-ligase
MTTERPLSSKERIRNEVSETLLRDGIAKPDPIFHFDINHFIPDFVDSDAATEKVLGLPEWLSATRIFITPDRSTQYLREVAIRQGKEIEVTTYGIARGAVLLTRQMVPEGQEAFAASLDGMERFGKPLTTLSDLSAAGHVDMMVTGAIAISNINGARTGKGAGWFDAEWSIWRTMNLVTPFTPIVGVVHGTQVVDETFEMSPWDVPVDIIATPSRVLRIPLSSRPEGIYWQGMESGWREAIPFMSELYQMNNQGTLTS